MRQAEQAVFFLLIFISIMGLGVPTWAQSGPQVSFSGDLGVGGSITTGAGIAFPDGTVQTTAAGAAEPGITANAGLYDNRIVDFSPPLPYVEVCFVGGSIEFDIHVNGGESTSGGDCRSGDRGWVIEREQRAAAYWEEARVECLLSGMRLIEPFEYMISCRRSQTLGLIGMTDGFEWAGNQALPIAVSSDPVIIGVVASVLGDGICNQGGFDYIARSDQENEDQRTFRCGR